MPSINSLEYWENRYTSKSWENNHGFEQTYYWGKLIIDNLPEEVKFAIKIYGKSIADVGCSCGQLTNIFAQEFPDSKVVGYDFSSAAISKAKELFPNIEFTSEKLSEKSDVLILSNILEHYSDAFDMLVKFIDKANKYVIVLCPYKENPYSLVQEHCISINENFFVEKINDFTKVFEKIIDVRQSGYWWGEMVLCVYSRDEIKIKTDLDKIQNENLNKIKTNKSKAKANKSI